MYKKWYKKYQRMSDVSKTCQIISNVSKIIKMSQGVKMCPRMSNMSTYVQGVKNVKLSKTVIKCKKMVKMHQRMSDV